MRGAAPGTPAPRARPAPAPPLMAFNDLLAQWVAAARVTSAVARTEAESASLQQQLDSLLTGRQQQLAPPSLTSPTNGSSLQSHLQQQQQRRRIPEEADGPAASATSTTTDCVATAVPALSPSARRLALTARRANLARLSAKLNRDAASLHTLRTAVLAKRQSLLPKQALLASLQAQALEHREHLAREKKHLDVDLRVQLHLLRLSSCFRRRVLLRRLLSITPIAPPHIPVPKGGAPRNPDAPFNHPLNCFMIRSLRLPNNFNNILTSFDEEQVSTALGYVAHVLLMLSKYLEVPLRYRLIYRGSRSVVCDDVTAGSQFPLYFKGMEERRFELGVILLNKNIEHLLNVRLDPAGPYIKHARELTMTLENLDLLFKSEFAQ